MKKSNRSMPRSEALESRAATERNGEMRDAQRQLAELGESAGLHEDWLESLVEPVSASQDSRKVRRVPRAG